MKRSLDFSKQAAWHQNRANFEAAERLHRKSLEELRKMPDPPKAHLANRLSNLASASLVNGKFEEAESLSTKALELHLMLDVSDPASVAATYINLGHSLERQGKLAEAERALLTALSMVDDLAEWRLTWLPGIYRGLALVYVQQGRIAEGDEYFEKARTGYAMANRGRLEVWNRTQIRYAELRRAATMLERSE